MVSCKRKNVWEKSRYTSTLFCSVCVWYWDFGIFNSYWSPAVLLQRIWPNQKAFFHICIWASTATAAQNRVSFFHFVVHFHEINCRRSKKWISIFLNGLDLYFENVHFDRTHPTRRFMQTPTTVFFDCKICRSAFCLELQEQTYQPIHASLSM